MSSSASPAADRPHPRLWPRGPAPVPSTEDGLIEHVPVAETAASSADVWRELQRSAEAAHRARKEAEQAATQHAEKLVRMEDAATEQAASARHEAVRRRAAEQLASETAEQVAVAHAERVRVEVEAKRQFARAAEAAEAHAAAERAAQDSAERAAAACEARREAEAAAASLSQRLVEADRKAADLAAARAATEAQLAEQLTAVESARAALAQAQESAARATLEREAAETRAQHLAAALEATRIQLLDRTGAAHDATPAATTPTLAPKLPPAATGLPTVAPVTEEQPAPDQPIWPEGAEQPVQFHSPSNSAVRTVVLGVAALVAAGFAVYQAYLDRLTETPGIVAAVVTLVLVVVIGRTRKPPASVWLEEGVLHVEDDEFHRKFDLATNDTLVQMVGQPGERRWKVLLLRKSRPTFKIDGSLVDPHEFVVVLRLWRPDL